MYQLGLKGSTEHDEGRQSRAQTGCHTPHLLVVSPLWWRCLALPQQLLLVLLFFKDKHFPRDLVLLLTKLWHDDSGCCVEWLSAQFQNAVYSLLTMLPWNTSWNNLSHCAMYQATGVAHFPSTPHSAGWTGHAPILVIKVYWPLLSPPQRKRSIIPGSFYPTSIN